MTGLTRSPRQAGGLEGLQPSKIPFFWPLSATNVAESGQKKRGAREVSPPSPSHRVSPVNDICLGMVQSEPNQLDSWGSAEGPKAPPHFPNGGGLGAAKPPPDPTTKCKVHLNHALGMFQRYFTVWWEREGGLPPSQPSFWPLSATNVADSGQKEVSWRARALGYPLGDLPGL